MAHDHILKAFRWVGGVNFKSNVQKIWVVLAFLAFVTLIEVVLGILKPDFLTGTYLFGMKLLNWIFIILTLVKAYYITWDFMHMRDEKSGLKRAVVWTAVFLVAYLAFILLIEGNYVFTVFKEGFMTWNF